MKKQKQDPDRGYKDLDLIQKEKWHIWDLKRRPVYGGTENERKGAPRPGWWDKCVLYNTVLGQS